MINENYQNFFEEQKRWLIDYIVENWRRNRKNRSKVYSKLFCIVQRNAE